MKRIIFGGLIVLFFIISSAFRPAHYSAAPILTEQEDSMVTIESWFCKNDSVIYRIQDTNWRITESDTVLNSATSLYVKVEVMDSTETGYKMRYSILDFAMEPMQGLSEQTAALFSEKMSEAAAGIYIDFETNGARAITGITNLEQVQRRAEESYDKLMEVLLSDPSVSSASSMGVDLKSVLEGIDRSSLAEEYTNDLSKLFSFNGKMYLAGKNYFHGDETDTSYAYDSTLAAYHNPDSGESSVYISTDTLTYRKMLLENSSVRFLARRLNKARL